MTSETDQFHVISFIGKDAFWTLLGINQRFLNIHRRIKFLIFSTFLSNYLQVAETHKMFILGIVLLSLIPGGNSVLPRSVPSSITERGDIIEHYFTEGFSVQ